MCIIFVTGDKALCKDLAENCEFYNTNPNLLPFVTSLHLAMADEGVPYSEIRGLKMALMGPLGMVVAIPLCAALKGLFIFYFEKQTKRQIVSWDGAVFQGQPFHDEAGDPVPAYDALGNDSFVSDSQLISDEAAPSAEAEPKPPELENPWANLMVLNNLQARGTGVFRNPFASENDDSAGDGTKTS